MIFNMQASANSRRTSVAAMLAVAWLAGAAAVHAEWLVTTDGGLIETRGPWRVEGSRVVFAAANGTLTAVRTGSIDFPATAAYAAELVAAAVPAAPPAPVEPALVLTDRDVPRVRAAEPIATTEGESAAPAEQADAAVAATEAAADAADPAAAEAPASEVSTTTPVSADATPPATASDNTSATASPQQPKTTTRALPPEIAVSSWQEQSLDDGLRFVGTLANDSKVFATQLRVEAAVYDEAGRLIDTKRAQMARTSISPGRSTTFEVSFPQIFTYGEVRFTPGGRALDGKEDSGSGAPAPADEPPR